MVDSWWLKVKRAQKHMVDIERALDVYTRSKPYEFVRVHEANAEGKVMYRLRITREPDPMLAAMLGDYVHNLRCALDHIVVASVPSNRRRNASFPITFNDLWVRDANGELMVNTADERQHFESAISGVDARGQALIKRIQPYHYGSDAFRWTLGIISRLENADKHRALTTFTNGLRFLKADVAVLGNNIGVAEHQRIGPRQFAKEGTVLGWNMPLGWREQGLDPAEVDMEYSGTPLVLIKISRIGGQEPPSDFPLRLGLVDCITQVRRTLRLLEPFVRR